MFEPSAAPQPHGFITIFSSDPSVVAMANLFGILAGAGLIFAVLRWLWKFASSAYHTSIKLAYLHYKRGYKKLIIHSSRDASAFISYLTLLFCIEMTTLLLDGLSLLLYFINAKHSTVPVFSFGLASLLFCVTLMHILYFAKEVHIRCRKRFYRDFRRSSRNATIARLFS